MHLPNFDIAKDRSKSENVYIDLKEDYKQIFQGKKYFLRTYGCQMNVHDSEAIRSYLETLGFTSTSHIEEANLITAKKMLEDTVEIPIIAKYTGLSIKKIKSLQDDKKD